MKTEWLKKINPSGLQMRIGKYKKSRQCSAGWVNHLHLNTILQRHWWQGTKKQVGCFILQFEWDQEEVIAFP